MSVTVLFFRIRLLRTLESVQICTGFLFQAFFGFYFGAGGSEGKEAE